LISDFCDRFLRKNVGAPTKIPLQTQLSGTGGAKEMQRSDQSSDRFDRGNREPGSKAGGYVAPHLRLYVKT
jgi:hypothetical protein